MRVALDPLMRQPALARALVDAAVDLARQTGARRARLWLPSDATWAVEAAKQAGFRAVRSVAHMLLAAEVPTPSAPVVPGLHIRSIQPGEEDAVLAALNRNWSDTWGFVPIPRAMLDQDLAGQREGMLLGFFTPQPAIVATCHAVYAPAEQNPDGHPRAWISNLTVDPNYRQRGIARAMLVAGIAHLRARGARSITLGVDADDPAPMRLYQSTGFVVVSNQAAWDMQYN
jgi:mycothiol synthase